MVFPDSRITKPSARNPVSGATSSMTAAGAEPLVVRIGRAAPDISLIQKASSFAAKATGSAGLLPVTVTISARALPFSAIGTAEKTGKANREQNHENRIMGQVLGRDIFTQMLSQAHIGKILLSLKCRGSRAQGGSWGLLDPTSGTYSPQSPGGEGHMSP